MFEIFSPYTSIDSTGRVIEAVWEDVKDGFKNSYPLGHSDEIIDTPRESLMADREIDLKSRAEKLNQTVQNNNQSGLNAACCTPSYYHSESLSSHEVHAGHAIPSEVDGRTHDPAVNSATLSSGLYEAEVSQAHPTTQELIDGHADEDSSQTQEQPKNPLKHLSEESVLSVQNMHPTRGEGRLQSDVPEQGRISSPAIKKSHSGRLDNDGKCFCN